MRVLAATSLLFSLAVLGVAQTPAEILRGEAKSYTLADIPDEYRAVTLESDGLSPWMLYGMAAGGSSKGSERLLFRALSAVWVQPDEFGELLDGKRPRIRGFRLDLQTMTFSRPSSGKVPAPKFTESWIEAGSIVSWSAAPELTKGALANAFTEAGAESEGMADVVAATPQDGSAQATASEKSARVSALKQVVLAVIMYSADNEDRFPRATASSQLAGMVGPYLRSNESLQPSPRTGRVLYNTYLTGEKMSSIAAPAETILVWEERTWPNGSRVVGFVDGHVKALSANEWSKAWKLELARRAEVRARAKRTK